jgi:hypothetical protein
VVDSCSLRAYSEITTERGCGLERTESGKSGSETLRSRRLPLHHYRRRSQEHTLVWRPYSSLPFSLQKVCKLSYNSKTSTAAKAPKGVPLRGAKNYPSGQVWLSSADGADMALLCDVLFSISPNSCLEYDMDARSRRSALDKTYPELYYHRNPKTL